MSIRKRFWVLLVLSMVLTVMLPDWERRHVWQGIPKVRAQAGLQTLNLNALGAGCTQLLTGTGTTKIWIYYGQLFINGASTGQTVTFTAGSANGTGSTCAGTQTSVGTVVVQATGTSATTSTPITIGPGSPAILIPTSSALQVILANGTSTSGYLTVSQQ